jgi:hypothetical protein
MEVFIRALITLCVIVLCVFLALWVLAELGIVLPAMVVKILWVIVVLLAVLYLLRALGAAGWKLWP